MELTEAWIDGSPVTSGEVIEVRSPYDDALLGCVPSLGEEHIDRAVAVALERHRAAPLPAHERAAILERAAVLLAERLEQFTASISGEAGKPIRTARVEAERALDTLKFSAAVARTSTTEVVPMDASAPGVGKLGWVRRVPIGVVAAISPFNFPLNLVCHKLAPAIAAGCPVVLKPASATPLTAIALVHLLEEAGLPPGWVNVVTVPGSVADHLVTHPDVSMVTFTGSPEVGWAIRGKAARIKVTLELGNNAPVLVEADADLDRAAERIVAGGYSYSGQSCISVQRVYAHRSVHDRLRDALCDRVAALVTGDPSDEATDVSALIARKETERVRGWVDDAASAGASVLVGGKLDDAGVLQPTVLDGIGADMRVSRDEVFGPVIGLAAYDDVDEAFAWANDTRYGLQAGIFTASLETALRAGEVLRFGGVTVNEVPTFRADQMPYGGVKDSGNTREGPAYTFEEMTERRLVIVQP